MKPASHDEIARAVAMARNGMSSRQIGKACGRSHTWAAKIAARVRGKVWDRPFFVGVRLTAEEYDALDKAARQNGRSYSAEIRARFNKPV